MKGLVLATLVALAGPLATPAAAQTLPLADAVLQKIWNEGMLSSQLMSLAQPLFDSIGPRLTGSPAIRSANDWAVAKYQSWGIEAKNEQYGTWKGWKRGVTHIDLLTPRIRTLEGTMLAWSPGTKGKVDGKVVIIPDVADSAAFVAWLPKARGNYVMISMPQPSCRPDANWKEFGLPEEMDKMQKDRTAAQTAWTARVTAAGGARNLPGKLEAAGAKGVLSNLWSAGWGVDKIFNARTEQIPTVDLSCEDYGLVYRLVEHNQNPTIRIEAEATPLGEVPVFNTIARIPGSEKPDEFVMLSAHFDSWDAGSGATDNGTGTITMMEALRILKTVYPKPKRTILVGHWSGEEQGLVGSRSFAADHPEIVKGLQALFNQDNGTGRVVNMSTSGLTGAGAFYGRWFARLPAELTRNITLSFPGAPAGGGSDNASFICYGAPGFGLGSTSWDYGAYTWHTNRDTFDKVVFDEVKQNATLAAMLAYLASEDPETIPRDRRVMAPDPRTGQATVWPACSVPPRKSSESTR
ncbi:MAG: M20/M25/M40 family metallo-hydrolase [Gemmatimonadota bacterium]|nr:M20/M25/M40 family metallo-hydrolase [Gemmatimonadota bacterium]